MTDADVLRDCASILRGAQDALAKRRGTIRDDHARKDVEFSIAALADEIGTLEDGAAALDKARQEYDADEAADWRREERGLRLRTG